MLVVDGMKGYGPLVVSIVTIWVTWFLGSRQGRIQKEQLKHQLYDRRMAVYDSFRDLLFALPQKGNDSDEEIKASFRKTDFARREIGFLFNDNQKIIIFAEKLCGQVRNEVVDNNDDLVVEPADTMFPEMSRPKLERIKQHEAAKLKIYEYFNPQLIELFGPFLKLTDNPKK